jgi:hypothetical protein
MDLVAQQKKSIEVQKGLFLIRYDSADDFASPPRVMISPDPGDAEGIKLILPPGTDEAILWSPGACIVLHAHQNGRIDVAVSPAQPNGSVGARIRLVPLSNDPGGLAIAGSAEAVSEGVFDPSQIRVMGHVAGVGDVVVKTGEWVAGPEAPSRIEGFILQWKNKPRDVGLRYAARIGGPRPVPTRMVDVGTFAGTRGRALPLVGATLEMSGAGANGHQLEVDALFLGSPQMRVVGPRVVISGPTGREPLIGLRVAIGAIGEAKRGRQASQRAEGDQAQEAPGRAERQKIRRARRVEAAASTAGDPEAKPVEARPRQRPPREMTGRLRVFRSDPKRAKKGKA